MTVKDITSHTKRLASEVEELRVLAIGLFTSQEEERRQIARELHDDVSQRLAAMEIDGDQVERNIGANEALAAEGMKRIRKSLALLSEDVRTLSHRLHPSIIEDLGLKPALQSLTEECERREGMITTFSSRSVPRDLPLEIAMHLYRITQEALRNASEHAGPTHVRVSLRITKRGIQLQVADFGHGFDTSTARPGVGLLSIGERTRHMGGTVRVESAPGEGTRITVNVPLTQAGQDARFSQLSQTNVNAIQQGDVSNTFDDGAFKNEPGPDDHCG